MELDCTLCKKRKPFYKFLSEKGDIRKNCEECYTRRKEICRRYVNNNPETRKESAKKYRENNRDKIRELGKKRRTEQFDKISEISRESIKRRKEDPVFVLRMKLRSLSSNYIRRASKGSKGDCELLGCSLEFLKLYIESQFQEGMTWENKGKDGWHIDHIIPLNYAENEEELYKLIRFENIRPYPAKKNLYKAKEMSSEDIKLYLNIVTNDPLCFIKSL